jgi:hypothetical protein
MGYQLIETITVGSGGAATLEFVGIPQDAVDLVCLTSLRSTEAANARPFYFYLNNSTSNYDPLDLYGDGVNVYSRNFSSSPFIDGVAGANYTANTFGSASVYVSNYTSSTAKSISADAVVENNATSSRLTIVALEWNDTSAVTSVLIQAIAGNFVEFSTASLYKVTAE